jgi:GNAT superfamily N-acetyltransferase
VPRLPVDVRRAGTDDLDDLLVLWAQARDEVARSGRSVGAPADQLRPRLQAALAGDDLHLLLARWDGRPAAYAAVRAVAPTPLFEGEAMQIEHLFVTRDLRRHGLARALLAAVAGLAERAGVDQVISSVAPSARESQRFFARLGFAPFVVRRVVTTATLRRRLTGEARRGALEDLLSRRRSLRARRAPSEPDPQVAEPAPAPAAAAVAFGPQPPPTLELPVVSDPAPRLA